LTTLAKQNLTPEMIQVGNETNVGMLHPLGKAANNNFKNFGLLLNSGIKAVRDFSKTSTIKPLIILHVAQVQNAEWWMKALTNSGGVTDYDILGMSHYAKWSTVTKMDAIGAIISNMKTTYRKDVMIVETAFPWTNKSADSYNNIIDGKTGVDTYSVSEAEQLRYMKDLTQMVITSGGIGVQYWEPAWISSNMKDRWGRGSSWENCTLFDFNGNALPAMDFMKAKYSF
jgi:arabinogalactan endo-1,4-beta-galactosidase